MGQATKSVLIFSLVAFNIYPDNKQDNKKKEITSVLNKSLEYAEKKKDPILQQIILSIIDSNYKDSFKDLNTQSRLESLKNEIMNIKNFDCRDSYDSITSQIKKIKIPKLEKNGANLKEHCDYLLVKYIPIFAKTLYRINQIRSETGLKPVIFSASISKGSIYHSLYLDKKGFDSSTPPKDLITENTKDKFYTDEGNKAAMNSDIASSKVMLPDVIDKWIATFYHRLPLINPASLEVGIGTYLESSAEEKPVCINTKTGTTILASPQIVTYPSNKQKIILDRFSDEDETPTPVPDCSQRLLSFPVTLTFHNYPNLKIKRVRFFYGASEDTIDIGTDSQHYLHTPDKPLNPEMSIDNTICILPKRFDSSTGSKYVKLYGRVFVEFESDGKESKIEITYEAKQ
ncbi:MAG: CAP domain-containing protein [Planctomycetes bacterium]|nr:CAP domain-containing protein [Planctomycetota bacterium]